VEPLTREAAVNYITLNFEELKQRATQMFIERMATLTSAEVCNRFLKAGEKYGDFDVNSIDIGAELEAEFCDIPSYVALGDLQK
jgi:hypothetical protein